VKQTDLQVLRLVHAAVAVIGHGTRVLDAPAWEVPSKRIRALRAALEPFNDVRVPRDCVTPEQLALIRCARREGKRPKEMIRELLDPSKPA
jgi:hypothetical protein